MIILPDRNIPRAKFLMPVSVKEWRTPSLSQLKDEFGNENTTKFHINAKSNDGVIIWRGWFDDREDFDAFLWAIAKGTLKQEKALWDLPTPNWQPYLGELVTYEFYTTTYLTSGAGSGNQTYTKPVDWGNIDNYIEAIGAGGSGGVGYGGSQSSKTTGGGGGEFRRIIDLTLSGNATYSIGAGGTSVGPATTSGQYINGNAGGATYFNGTSSGAASLYAAPGQAGGGSGVTGGILGSAGGTGGTGSAGNANGGRSGNATQISSSTGGGGAAGPGSSPSKTSTPVAGNQGVDATSQSASWAGGAGNGGSGGAGGTNGGGAGGNGLEYGSFGSGGGGGGNRLANAGAAGNYGGGGGSSGGTFAASGTSGVGRQGIIIINYEPQRPIGFNMPFLGI